MTIQYLRVLIIAVLASTNALMTETQLRPLYDGFIEKDVSASNETAAICVAACAEWASIATIAGTVIAIPGTVIAVWEALRFVPVEKKQVTIRLINILSSPTHIASGFRILIKKGDKAFEKDDAGYNVICSDSSTLVKSSVEKSDIVKERDCRKEGQSFPPGTKGNIAVIKSKAKSQFQKEPRGVIAFKVGKSYYFVMFKIIKDVTAKKMSYIKNLPFFNKMKTNWVGVGTCKQGQDVDWPYGSYGSDKTKTCAELYQSISDKKTNEKTDVFNLMYNKDYDWFKKVRAVSDSTSKIQSEVCIQGSGGFRFCAQMNNGVYPTVNILLLPFISLVSLHVNNQATDYTMSEVVAKVAVRAKTDVTPIAGKGYGCGNDLKGFLPREIVDNKVGVWLEYRDFAKTPNTVVCGTGDNLIAVVKSISPEIKTPRGVVAFKLKSIKLPEIIHYFFVMFKVTKNTTWKSNWVGVGGCVEGEKKLKATNSVFSSKKTCQDIYQEIANHEKVMAERSGTEVYPKGQTFQTGVFDFMFNNNYFGKGGEDDVRTWFNRGKAGQGASYSFTIKKAGIKISGTMDGSMDNPAVRVTIAQIL